MADNKTAYELERDRRVEENKRKMQELGIAEAAAVLEEPAKPAVKRQRRAAAAPAEEGERRTTGRERKAVNYCEMEGRGAGAAREPRAPVDYTERIQGITLDQEKAEQLRADLEAKRKEGAKATASAKTRGPVDSGKGVRIQGGKVYDSKHGVTCHWCRQKTLEDHVTCTNECCGNGRRMPLSFCAKCLRNRHGEDFEAAEASGSWWCPTCRGSCGPGCVICCNCGPCRKKAGLEPTHQVVKLARDAGFDNVHDYLVHLVTGDAAEVIAERKLGHSWGAWLKGEGSEASEQTGGEAGGSGGGCRGGHKHGAAAAAAGGSEQAEEGAEQEAPNSADKSAQVDAAVQKDQRAAATKRGKGRGRAAAAAGGAGSSKKAAAKPPAAKGGRKGSKASRAAAAAAEKEAEEEEQQQEEPQQSDREEEEEGPEDFELPLLSSQDATLSRKERIAQKMGLKPVTVCA